MKNTKAWARSLPLANPVVAARQLIARLEEWNKAKAPPKLRYAALEDIGEPAMEVLDALRRGLNDVSFPLRSRQQNSADLSDSLLALIFEGYELVFSEAEAPGSSLLSKHFVGLWTLSAHRLFCYARPLLTERQRLNFASNDGLWMRLHGVYRLVMSNRLQGSRIAMPCRECGKRSIEALYKEVLLMSMLPLQELHRAQRFEIENTLPEWSDLLTIHDGESEKYATADFAIDFHRDQGPIGFSGKEEASSKDQLLMFDSARLLTFLQRIVRKKDRDKHKATDNSKSRAVNDERYNVSPRTLELLTQACKPNYGRLEIRTQTLELADAYYTFSGVHYHLSKIAEAGGLVEHVEYSQLVQAGSSAVFSGGGDRQWESFCVDTEILDVSDNGMRIEFDGGRELSVRVGDVVGIRRKGADLPLLGQIRWLAVIAGSRLSAGIYLWCKNPSRATLALRGNDGSKASLPAILGEHIKTGKVLLIISYLPGIHKKHLNLIKSGGRLPVRLQTRPAEYSQAFAAYEFGIPSGWQNGRHQRVMDLSMRALGLLFKKSSDRSS